MVYRISRFFVMLFYHICYPHKIFGKENLPEKSGFVTICNHYGAIDVVVVSDIFKKKPYMLAKKEWFASKFRAWLFRKYGAIPIDREKPEFSSLKECFAVLKRGDNLVIFPEGTRNRKGEELMDIKGGAALIAYKAKVPVVPVVMLSRYRKFHKNYLMIGKPFDFSSFSAEHAGSDLNEKLREFMLEKMTETREELKKIVGEKKR